MISPTRFVWDAAGRPDVTGPATRLLADEHTVCVMCGYEDSPTAPARQALGDNFTDHYAFARPDSERICRACIWVTSGRPPASLRMWSVVVAPEVMLPPSQPKAWLQVPGVHLTSRADTTTIISTLLAPPPGPWLVSVAISAQKHVVPFATVNRGAGRWTVRMEGVDVTATPDEWRDVLRSAASLRAAGHTADDIRSAAPTLARIRSCADLDWWEQHAARLTDWRGSPLLDLALWALTKETTPTHADPRPDNSDHDLPRRAAQLRLC